MPVRSSACSLPCICRGFAGLAHFFPRTATAAAGRKSAGNCRNSAGYLPISAGGLPDICRNFAEKPSGSLPNIGQKPGEKCLSEFRKSASGDEENIKNIKDFPFSCRINSEVAGSYLQDVIP
jgi:hypothetical protein